MVHYPGHNNFDASSDASPPQTIIVRHHKERLSKCSVQPLFGQDAFLFFTFRKKAVITPDFPTQLPNYIRLDPDGEPLSATEDAGQGILIIDATWRYAEKIKPLIPDCPTRSLPGEWRTAYPRRQPDAPDPERGLASIEALFAALFLLRRDTAGLLDDYYWREEFLELNRELLSG